MRGDGYFNLGNILARHGKPAEAIACLQEAVKLDPQSAEYHNSLGAVLASQGRIDEAVDQFRASLRINRVLSWFIIIWEGLVVLQGRIDEAIQNFHEALRLDPGFKPAQANLKDALALRGKSKI